MGTCNAKHANAESDESSAPVARGAPRHPQSNDSASTTSSSQNPSAQRATQTSNTPMPGSSQNPSHSGNTNESSSTAELLLTPGRPLPTDPAALRSLVQSLQHALAQRELTLREKEKELQSEKAQRVNAATGVLNQAMKIIRPSQSGGNNPNNGGSGGAGGTGKRESFSQGGANGVSSPDRMSNGISPSLIQLHEKQKAAAAEVASAAQEAKAQQDALAAASESDSAASNSAAINSAAMNPPPSPNLSSSTSLLPAPASAYADSAASSFEDDSSILRRELMDVLLQFAETELIAPNAEKAHGGHGSSTPLMMNNESFSAVISQSNLDDVTKQWLTAEFTRDQPLIGASTRQRHVSVVNTNRSLMSGSHGLGTGSGDFSSSGGPSSLYPNAKLLISPDLISLSSLESWEFDPLAFSPEILVIQAMKMFESLDLLKRFNIAPDKLSNFLFGLEANYIASNPYHNFFHGIDVLHCCWMYLKSCNVVHQAKLRSLDILAFLISAVCHDLGHPGTNNNYQISTRSELSMIYNGQS